MVAPLVSISRFENEIEIDLASGVTVALQLFGLIGVATLLSGSAGAELMIIRLS